MSTLVELAREGNARAFEFLVKRHRVRLFAVALRHTGNFDDAADVFQETVTRAWERLEVLRDPERFPSWLERIAVHLCLDARRRYRRQPPVLSLDAPVSSARTPSPPLVETLPAAPKPSDARQRILDQEIAMQLLRAIEALPGTLREAAFLRFIEGDSTERIAGTLGIEYEAAKKRIYRATLELRRRLQPLYEELVGPFSP